MVLFTGRFRLSRAYSNGDFADSGFLYSLQDVIEYAQEREGEVQELKWQIQDTEKKVKIKNAKISVGFPGCSPPSLQYTSRSLTALLLLLKSVIPNTDCFHRSSLP